MRSVPRVIRRKMVKVIAKVLLESGMPAAWRLRSGSKGNRERQRGDTDKGVIDSKKEREKEKWKL